MSSVKSLLRSCSITVVRVKIQADKNFLCVAVTKANKFQTKIILKVVLPNTKVPYIWCDFAKYFRQSMFLNHEDNRAFGKFSHPRQKSSACTSAGNSGIASKSRKLCLLFCIASLQGFCCMRFCIYFLHVVGL